MKRRFFFLCSLISFLIVLGIVFLPQLLSLPIGKTLFLNSVQTKTHVQVTAQTLRLSWFGPQKMDDIQIEGTNFRGSIDHLTLEVPLWTASQILKLKNIHQIHGNLKLNGGSFAFVPDVQLSGMEANVKIQEGVATVFASGSSHSGTLDGSFSFNGQILSSSDFSLNGSIVSFPTLPLARLIHAQKGIDEQALREILGDWINLKGNASVQKQKGFLDLSLDSSNITSAFLGTISKDIITLNQPLTATIRLTPQLCERILRDVNPLFLTGIQARNPIQLRIESHNFRLPLNPFSLKNIEIEQGTLSVGQIRAKNGASLASLVGLLKNSPLSRTSEMNLWFAPMPFSLKNGILHTGRMDVLVADAIHICTWGEIDLIDHQLDLFLGLTAQALEYSFGIKDLRSDYVLKIPITGSTSHPKIATEAAAVKIAALKASQMAFKGSAPGNLLKMFIPNEKGVPSPRRPYPWE